MNCPRCTSDNNRVVSSYTRGDGLFVRRRRQCHESACLHRWSTDELPSEFVEQVMDFIAAHRGVEKSLIAISADGRSLLSQYVSRYKTA